MISLASTHTLAGTNALDISKEQAIEIAKTEASNMTFGENTLYNTDNDFNNLEINATLVEDGSTGLRKWIACFFAPNLPPPACVVEVSSESGEILHIAMCDMDIRVIRERIELQKGPYPFWSLEDKAMFDAIYLNPAEIFRNTLPTNALITQEQAIDNANKIIRTNFKASDSVLGELKLSVSYWAGNVSPDEGDPNDCMWVIAYHSYINGIWELIYQVNVSSTDGTVYLVYPDKNSNG